MIQKGQSDSRITLDGVRAIVRDLGLVLINMLVLLWAAGTLRWINAWVYLAFILLQQANQAFVLSRSNPQVLNERGRTLKEGTLLFDRIFVPVFVFSSLIISAVAGMDAIRFQWLPLPQWLLLPGAALFAGASLFGAWAMGMNRHFEMTIRIQEERQHTVCESGPYRCMRHPGYAAWITAALSYPMILGSAVSFVPVAVLIAVFIARTAVEDRFLRQNLAGYNKYVEKVRYRLVPYFW